MKRFNYGQNFTAVNSGVFSAMTPLGFLETAPGDTITGKFTCNIWSDTTKRPIMNRTYFDTFAFYIPFRLLDENFPDFVRGESETGQQSTTGTVDFFFERPANTGSSSTVWNRRGNNPR